MNSKAGQGEGANAWEQWLYPELRAIDRARQREALRQAREFSFDMIEIIGIAVGLVIAVVLTRYSGIGFTFPSRLGLVVANFVLALLILAPLAGPFYIRRTRRGLREALHGRSAHPADKS